MTDSLPDVIARIVRRPIFADSRPRDKLYLWRTGPIVPATGALTRFAES
jgi:hypothetical protein